MKRSSTWFTLILIASALLLSAVKLVAQNSSRPSQSLSQQGNNTAEKNQTYSGQWVGTWTRNSPTSQPSPNQERQQGNQNTPRLSKSWEWVTDISAQAVFNFLVMVATIAIAIFTYQLIHTNRPFLILQAETLNGFHPPSTQEKMFLDGGSLLVQITVRNAGNSPAVIESAVGLLIISDKAPKKWRWRYWSRLARYDECHPAHYISQRMLALNETADIVSSVDDARELTQEEFDTIKAGRLRIYYYGRIRYRSILRARFWSDFYYLYVPPDPPIFERGNLIRIREYTRSI